MSIFTRPWSYLDVAKFRGVRRRRRLLAQLSEGQNHRCCYCGRRFGEDGPGSVASLEHLQRVADGGGDTFGNCVAACVRCNSRRDLSPSAWFVYVTSRLASEPLPRKLRWRWD